MTNEGRVVVEMYSGDRVSTLVWNPMLDRWLSEEEQRELMGRAREILTQLIYRSIEQQIRRERVHRFVQALSQRRKS